MRPARVTACVPRGSALDQHRNDGTLCAPRYSPTTRIQDQTNRFCAGNYGEALSSRTRRTSRLWKANADTVIPPKAPWSPLIGRSTTAPPNARRTGRRIRSPQPLIRDHSIAAIAATMIAMINKDAGMQPAATTWAHHAQEHFAGYERVAREVHKVSPQPNRLACPPFLPSKSHWHSPWRP